MTVQPYDFCKPERIVSSDRLASDMERSLESWLRDACALGPKKWARQLPFALEVGFGGIDILRPADGLGPLPDNAVGFRVPIADGDKRCLLALPRPLVIALSAGLLGDEAAELPADRELTAIEHSLCDHLVQNLLLSTLQDTWRGAVPLRFGQPKPEPNAKWSRPFRPDQTLILSSFSVKGPFGEQPWFLVMGQDDVLGLFGLGPTPPDAASALQQVLTRANLEQLVREVRVDIVVQLGSVELPVTQLAKLQVGDVIVLDSRVNEPLTATVGGNRKLLGWPGRVGSRQAFQIDAPTEG